MTEDIREQIEPEKKEEGIRIPGVGTLPLFPKKKPGDQSALPPMPGSMQSQPQGLASLQRQDYESLFPQDPLGAAISKRGMV